jgi:hypothetical protein
MYLMYVDESGDAGLGGSPTRYFVLTGMVVHELRWHDALTELIAFRKRMRTTYGLLMREEIHAGRMLTRPGALVRIKRNERLAIIRHFLDQLAGMQYLSFINVRIDKSTKTTGYGPFEQGWKILIQRFENTLNRRNFPGPANADDRGTIFCDETDDAALRKLYRKMRTFNPIPNMSQHGVGYRQMPLIRIVEDPSIRRSHHSYFIQAADVAAFALYQRYAPSQYVRHKGARNLFDRLDPVLCKVASTTNKYGIVEV